MNQEELEKTVLVLKEKLRQMEYKITRILDRVDRLAQTLDGDTP